MIITRTPFRISFAGGGSDLKTYYSNEPGCVISAAIARYMYLTVTERFGNTFRVSYSHTELTDTVDEIKHPLVRECLKVTGVQRGLEIVSIADLPAGSGMGSSSSFTVGLLHALHAVQGRVVSAASLAEKACEIEINRLGEPIGKQDQYIAAYGGLQFIQFMPDGQVFVDPVICSAETRDELNHRLLLFFTGVTRDAREVLVKQHANTPDRLSVLRELCSIAREMRDVITLGRDLNTFGKLLHQAWQTKKQVEDSITSDSIDSYYERGLTAGALGGKLLGAGGGGFILFYCEPHLQRNLRCELSELTEIPFKFEPEGSKVIYVGSDHW
jgi:D-glycero-alpha-D-manno-heptose-7-phosphate kinase